MATATPDTKAQDTNKAPAAAAPKKGEYNKELHDSLKKKDDGDEVLSDAEHATLLEQMSLKRVFEAEGRKKFEDLVESIAKSGFQFSRIYKAVALKNDGMRAEVASLFSQDEITAAFKAGGGKVGAGRAASTTGGTPAAPKVRNSIKPIKSTVTGAVTFWAAAPPTFLESEGAHTAYKEGKSVDKWLVEPSNKAQKGNFLAKMAKKHDKKPTKEQLGELTEADVKMK